MDRLLKFPYLWIKKSIAGIVVPLQTSFQHGELFLALLKRDFTNRTSNTFLGLFWLILQPALQVAALWFLMNVIIRVRFPEVGSFSDYFLIGMIPWLAINEIILRSSRLYQEFSALFKRNPFPIIILPVLSILFTLMIYGVIFMFMVFLIEGYEKILPAFIFILAIAIMLLPVTILTSTLCVFFKDIAQALPFIMMMLLYLSPILYIPQMMPESLQAYLILNPIADLMALLHYYIQDIQPIHDGMIGRLLVLWLITLAPAWIFFSRSTKHIRELI